MSREIIPQHRSDSACNGKKENGSHFVIPLANRTERNLTRCLPVVNLVLLSYRFLAQLWMILRAHDFHSLWLEQPSGVRGVLSSNTTSACHFEPKAVNCNKIGRASLPFSVRVHRTIIDEFPSRCTL